MNPALDRHRQLVEQHPGNELARFSYGKALYDAGQLPAAKEQFNLALHKKPDWMVVQILIGKCELAEGNRVAAKQAFERARQLALEQHHEGPLAEMDELLAQMD